MPEKNSVAAHSVIISLASNRFQKSNLMKARQALESVLADTMYTEELWTEPVTGSQSQTPDNRSQKSNHEAQALNNLYLNQLVRATTPLSLDELNARLKQIEVRFGRTIQKRLHGVVPIDLDILLYDDTKLHERDWQRPYVTSLITML